MRFFQTTLAALLSTLNIWSAVVCCCAMQAPEPQLAAPPAADMPACHQPPPAQHCCASQLEADQPSVTAAAFPAPCDCSNHAQTDQPVVVIASGKIVEVRTVLMSRDWQAYSAQTMDARLGLAATPEGSPPDNLYDTYLSPTLKKLCRFLI